MLLNNLLKSFFLRLYLLTYSPIFPMLLGSIIFLAYRVYFDPVVMLCDDNGYRLFQLKSELTTETANYRTAVIKCERYYDLQEQLESFKETNPQYNNPEQERAIADGIRNSLADKIRALAKVRRLETSIRGLTPRFQSPIYDSAYYPRIGRGY
jgi:hypothetical protein